MKPKSKLTELLESMLERAMQTTHIPIKRNLKSGLKLTLTADAHGVTLIMQRDSTLPSDTEIKTVLKYWPYYTGEVSVSEIHYDGRPALKLEIKAPQEVAKYL